MSEDSETTTSGVRNAVTTGDRRAEIVADLLAELQRAEKFIGLAPRNYDMERLRAAIAKAQGEAPR